MDKKLWLAVIQLKTSKLNWVPATFLSYIILILKDQNNNQWQCFLVCLFDLSACFSTTVFKFRYPKNWFWSLTNKHLPLSSICCLSCLPLHFGIHKHRRHQLCGKHFVVTVCVCVCACVCQSMCFCLCLCLSIYVFVSVLGFFYLRVCVCHCTVGSINTDGISCAANSSL